MANTKRSEGIELLRIISMLCIVGGHFILFTGFRDGVEPFSINYYMMWIVYAINFAGTNCYVLISGYFSEESKFSLKKLGKLWGTVLFYSLGITLILLFTGLKSYAIRELLSSATPYLTRQYWFMTDFMGLFIFSPFLKIAISAMDEKTHRRFVVISAIIFSVLPSIWIGGGIDGSKGYSLMWFVVLYMIGAYIRKYGIHLSKTKTALIYTSSVAGIALTKFVIAGLFQLLFQTSTSYDNFAYCNNFPLMLTASVSLFLLCKDIKIKSEILRKATLAVSKLTLGVYLVHMHPGLANIYWQSLPIPGGYSSATIWLWYVAITISVFVVSALVEYLRTVVVRSLCKLLNIVKEKRKQNEQKI